MADIPTTPSPNLGYGKQTEASLDTVNQWMRSQPWYAAIRGNSAKLNDQQRKAILRAAQANGVVVDEGDVNIDSSGNLDNKGHKLRNTIIVAGIAAAAIAAPYVLPALTSGGGAAGAGAAATAGGTAAGTAGGVLGSTAIGTGMMGGIAGGTGLAAGTTAAGLGTAGTLGTAAKIGGLLTTGKSASGYLGTAGQIANVLGDYSQGRAAGRVGEMNAAFAQDQAAMDRARAELEAKRFALTAPGARASNSVRGDILANARDASISLPSTIPRTTIGGGLRPSMFSDATRALGAGMSADALAGQQSGADTLRLPTPTAIPQAGKLDSWLNTAATVGSLASAIPYRRAGRIPQPGDPDYVPATPQRR